MDFLDKLNPQQRQAVTAGAGPVLVLAGPGSGKTRVLTQRVAYLIAYEGVRPYQMLAVTFTNKAAREMGNRVRDMLGELASDGLWLGTFHSICARLLRRESEQLPFDANFVIYDDDDQQRVALTEMVVKQYGQSLVMGSAAGAGSGFFFMLSIALIIRKMTRAMITKSITLLMKLP